MNKLTALALLVGIALGVGVTFALTPKYPSESAEVETPRSRARSQPIADKGDQASLGALRARVAELEAELAGRADFVEKEERSPERIRSHRRGEGERMHRGEGRDGRDWMARLEKEDPERFVQMTNRMENFRRHREGERARKYDYLQSLNTSTLNASARNTHTKLLENIETVAELEAKIADSSLSEEERRECFENLRTLHDNQRQLNRIERENLIAQYAEESGLSAEAAQMLKDEVIELIEITEDQRGMGGPGGRGGRGGMPPPPPPGGF